MIHEMIWKGSGEALERLSGRRPFQGVILTYSVDVVWCVL